jgi:hypothetical protein
MKAIKLHNFVERTKENDVFVYKATSVSNSMRPLQRPPYRLEIADFPGERSVEFVSEEYPYLHTTQHFQWAMGADAFIFVIDASRCLEKDGRDEYVVTQDTAFKAAWQRILDYHIDRGTSLKRRPVLVVYSKADIYFGERYESGLDYDMENLKRTHERLDAMFKGLIDFLKRHTTDVQTALTSSQLNQAGVRLGVGQVAKWILPRETLINSLSAGKSLSSR